MVDKTRGVVAIGIELPNGARLDAEDVALIEIIRSCRSIVGASRLAGHSYRKTWLMVDALNRAFETRVIDTFPGRKGGGAEVTVFGERVVALYRSVERRARRAAEGALAELGAASDPRFNDGVADAAPATDAAREA